MSVADSLLEAQRIAAERQAAGFDQVPLEAAVRMGLANGAFEDGEDEGEAVVEEFYPTPTDGVGSLNDKLQARLDQAGQGTGNVSADDGA